MANHRDRRGHVLPPSRKGRRYSIASVIRQEHLPIGDTVTDLDVMFSLTPQGRRALLEDRHNRSDWRP